MWDKNNMKSVKIGKNLHCVKQISQAKNQLFNLAFSIHVNIIPSYSWQLKSAASVQNSVCLERSNIMYLASALHLTKSYGICYITWNNMENTVWVWFFSMVPWNLVNFGIGFWCHQIPAKITNQHCQKSTTATLVHQQWTWVKIGIFFWILIPLVTNGYYSTRQFWNNIKEYGFMPVHCRK